MAEERGVEAEAFWMGARARGGDMSRFASALAGGAQRARLLVNGVAGPLSERQRALAMDILRDLEQLCDEAGSASQSVAVNPEPFDLGALCADVVGAWRFVAHRKQLALTLLGSSGHCICIADSSVVRDTLTESIGTALAAAAPGIRVAVEITRSADRLAVDISAPGWNPRLPAPPPAGSGAALSVLRTASGARLVLSVPAAL